MLNARIASPCSANWEQMHGDNRVRHCAECNLQVFNFSEMTSTEIESVVAVTTGRLCARFYQRTDGTMLTKNCPVGFRSAILRASHVAAATLTAILSIVPARAASSYTPSVSSLLQIQPARDSVLLEVVDPQGAAVANAKITILNEKTGAKIKSVTNGSGNLMLAGLPPGLFEITVIATGFPTLTQTHMQLLQGKSITLRLNFPNLMGEVVAIEHRNFLQKFFSKLRHLV
jgi:hypothetical protein